MNKSINKSINILINRSINRNFEKVNKVNVVKKLRFYE